MSRDAPLHVQVLAALKTRIANRQRGFEERCGRGLPDQDYQRHVGRIAACKLVLEDLEQLMKGGIETLEDLEDERREQQEHRAQRRAQSTRRG